MHCRFCGWRRVSIQWPGTGDDKRRTLKQFNSLVSPPLRGIKYAKICGNVPTVIYIHLYSPVGRSISLHDIKNNKPEKNTHLRMFYFIFIYLLFLLRCIFTRVFLCFFQKRTLGAYEACDTITALKGSKEAVVSGWGRVTDGQADGRTRATDEWY